MTEKLEQHRRKQQKKTLDNLRGLIKRLKIVGDINDSVLEEYKENFSCYFRQKNKKIL